MKKFTKLLILLLVLLVPVTFANAASAKKTTTTTTSIPTDGEPVKFYIFYGSTCSHCADLHAFVDDLEADKDYNFMFEVVDYEVWEDKTNASLMQNVAKELGTTASGVPFYVIGEYYSSGFPNPNSGDTYKEVTDAIKAEIKNAYLDINSSNPTYKDIVASVGVGNTTVDGVTNSSGNNDIVGYILLGITVIIIIGIVFGRSSTKDDEEDKEPEIIEDVTEEVEEEVKPAKKEEAKKTTSKKTTTSKKSSSTAKKSTSKKSTSTSKKTTTKKNK